MANNNKISQAILFWAPHVEGQQWLEADELAAQLDRLVEEAKEVVSHWALYCDQATPRSVIRLRAALRDIETGIEVEHE